MVARAFSRARIQIDINVFQYGRQGGAEQFDTAVEPFDDAFEGDEGFEEHHKVTEQGQSVAAHDGCDVVDDLADAQVADGGVFVVEQHFQNVCAEQVFVGQIALRPVAEDVLDEQCVVVGQGVDEVEDFAATGVAEVSDQPEVDEGDAAVIVDEDVARMGVGMEKALPQHHGEEGVGNPSGKSAAQGWASSRRISSASFTS